MKFWSSLLTICLGLLLGAPASAQDFYSGKTLRIIVGFPPGGGFDVYARTLARYMGKHIPGNPTTIVENLPGAGSLIAANHLFRRVNPDGLTMGHFIGGLVMGQVLGRAGIEFDAPRFEYVGVPTKDTSVCAVTKRRGITSMEKWLGSKTPVKLGGTVPGSTTDDHPKILAVALGLPVHVVSGYKGTNDIRLAAEGGEVDGGCWGWQSMKATWSRALQAGDVAVVVQLVPKANPDLPSVPLAISFAKTAEARHLIQVGIHDMDLLLRTFALPPGTPKDRVQIIRKAFVQTMNDPEFLADANKSKLDIDPGSGEEVEKTVINLFKLEPRLLGKFKEILK
ncbi:MAG: hypothetical protein HYT78_11890 [Deltaproteobacteria bacterium]|nr:hypothetical protein [Deltaproteobacteria bacterium]